MKYLVNVAGRTVEVDLRADSPLVDGAAMDARLFRVAGTPLHVLKLGNDIVPILAEEAKEQGTWTIQIEGLSLEVEALDERARAIREMAGVAPAESDKVIRAPMPGLVVKVEVEPGETVVAGQGIAVIEAMKMENEMRSPADGVIATVEATAGQVVEKGMALATLE